MLLDSKIQGTGKIQLLLSKDAFAYLPLFFARENNWNSKVDFPSRVERHVLAVSFQTSAQASSFRNNCFRDQSALLEIFSETDSLSLAKMLKTDEK